MYVRYDPPAERKTGAVMIVLPGGNYDESDIFGGEAQPIAQWLAANGITGVVLQYRCVSQGHFWPAQFDDWNECARSVREQAETWGCDPNRIGVIGFSAGGHLASYSALRADPCVRPKLQVLVYPAIDVLSPHEGGSIEPWRASLGYPSVESSTHLLVNRSAPPAFVAGIVTDKYTPAKENSDVYVRALRENNVHVRYVRCRSEEHGCGLSDWWSEPCEAWLREQGWACASSSYSAA